MMDTIRIRRICGALCVWASLAILKVLPATNAEDTAPIVNCFFALSGAIIFTVGILWIRAESTSNGS